MPLDSVAARRLVVTVPGSTAGLGVVPIAPVVAGFVVVAGLVLSGCAGLPQPAESQAAPNDAQRWALHRVRVEAVSSWRIQGKVSIRRADRLWQVGLNWLHDAVGDSLDLLGPGGRPVMRLQSRPDGARAVDSKGRRYRAPTFEALAAEALGVEVPVSSLRYWVAGLPAPDARVDSLRLNQDGRLDELEQGGWRVRYLRYRPVVSASLYPLELPSLLALTRGEVEVTVAANRWRLLKFTKDAEQAI